MRAHFLQWQCRIRQIAMRQFGGRPTPGMRPRVLTTSGEEVMPAMTVVLVPLDPSESNAYFKFQVQKTPDPRRVYEAVLSFLQADYYGVAGRFSDELTAQFAPRSATAAAIVKRRRCLLEFEQYSQKWRMACAVRRLRGDDLARIATLLHNRAFDPGTPADAVVLGFSPDWRSAAADPLPPGLAGAAARE